MSSREKKTEPLFYVLPRLPTLKGRRTQLNILPKEHAQYTVPHVMFLVI